MRTLALLFCLAVVAGNIIFFMVDSQAGVRNAAAGNQPAISLHDLFSRPASHLANQDTDTARLYAQLDALHAAPPALDCTAKKYIIFKVSLGGVGWGVQYGLYMPVVLQLALESNRSIVYSTAEPLWNYGLGWCPHGLACVMDQLDKACAEWANTEYLRVEEQARQASLFSENTNTPPMLTAAAQLHTDQQFWVCDLALTHGLQWQLAFSTHMQNISGIPPQFPSKQRNLLWWKAALASYAFRPNAAARDYISHAVAALTARPHAPPPARVWFDVAVHIRHGTKLTDQNSFPDRVLQLFDATRYHAELQRVCRTHACRSAYVTSDDPAGIALLVALHRGPASLFVDPLEMRLNGTEHVTGAGLTDPAAPRRMALDGVKNLFLFSRASYFVGTFSSIYGRLMYMLMVANGMPPHHFCSLDYEAWDTLYNHWPRAPR